MRRQGSVRYFGARVESPNHKMHGLALQLRKSLMLTFRRDHSCKVPNPFHYTDHRLGTGTGVKPEKKPESAGTLPRCKGRGPIDDFSTLMSLILRFHIFKSSFQNSHRIMLLENSMPCRIIPRHCQEMPWVGLRVLWADEAVSAA